VDTGGSIVGCHDLGDDSLCLGYGLGTRIGNFDVLLPELSRAGGLLVCAVLGLVADSLRLSAAILGGVAVERLAQADAERVFLVGELVDEIARVAPKREVGIGIGSVEGGARALLIVVVEQMGRIAVPLACRRRGEGVEWDIRRPPAAVRKGRNFEDERLTGSSLDSTCWCKEEAATTVVDARHRAQRQGMMGGEAVKAVTLEEQASSGDGTLFGFVIKKGAAAGSCMRSSWLPVVSLAACDCPVRAPCVSDKLLR